MHCKLVNGLVKVKLRAQTKAVNGARAILPKENFVDVRGKQVFLRKPQLQNNGHGHFAEFASVRALVGQEVALNQLLSQGAASLGARAAAGVHPSRAQNSRNAETSVIVKVAILYGFQTLCKQRRHLLWCQNQPVFAMGGKEAANGSRVEANQRYFGIVFGLNSVNDAILKTNFHPLRGSAAFHKVKAAQIGEQSCPVAVVASGCGEVCI